MTKKLLGVDIGGTSIKLAVINGDKIEKKTVFLLGKKHPLDVLINLVDSMVADQGEFMAIAVASAGRIDAEKGIVLYASPNIPNWTGTPLAEILSKRYGIPCFVLNDAKAAVLGEARVRGVDNLVMLTIGTGLGGGIVINGRIIHGSHYEAGEIGHTILRPNGRLCNCGKKGCAEQYVSMRVLHKYSGVRDRKQLIEMFQNRTKRVVAAVEHMCEDLAVLVDKLFLIFDPQLLAIGGGVTELGPFLLEILRRKIEPYACKSLYDASQVELSLLGNDAGMIGAAIYARERLLEAEHTR